MPFPIVLGFIFGLISAVFFAGYMVPQKITRIDTVSYLWLMSLGVLGSALMGLALAGFPHATTWEHRGYGLLCGLVWGFGTAGFSAGIARIGMALATPIKNTTAVLGTLVGLIFLQEWRTTNPWWCLVGSVLVAGAAIIIGLTRREATQRRAVLAGVACSLFAAVAYASYGVPMKRAMQTPTAHWEFTPWMALGICITATTLLLTRRDGLRTLRAYPMRDRLLALLGGMSWTLAFYALAVSMKLVDFAVAWTLSNLNTIPAVVLGILAFREIDWRTHRGRILLGLAAATLGTVFLALAKSRPVP